MYIAVCIFMFIIGTIFGSFYNVVGYRLAKGESIAFPPSHCTKCNSRLGASELIPIFSYLIQKGRCKHCHAKISGFYPFFECLTGILFMLSFIVFGFTPELIIALTFVSMLIIIIVSDYEFMIIPDEVLIFFSILLFGEIFFIHGIEEALLSLVNGLAAFLTMFAIKKFGDFIFKKESMGGGDIKLMFVFGMVLSYPISILTIFVSSLIGFPISLILLKKNASHIIPFGPFLAAGALILFFTQIDFNTILNMYNF